MVVPFNVGLKKGLSDTLDETVTLRRAASKKCLMPLL